ncbi:glycosyltransferase family 2 protein (plasmid) [Kitasatospora sp. NBC_00070]|uniref:glycosyltransferase family 2 protein n=1 Tax=Kitasatospora sp. NBC_00070 TaxID=2975962 RepID=UPI002F9176C9
MKTLSIVIPALNEAPNLPSVMASIPMTALANAGWEPEVVLVDNASTDGTAEIAHSLGARVVHEHRRGYGQAYKAGFAAARGEVIATGDCDGTYPFGDLPDLLRVLIRREAEFLTTDRLYHDNREAMKRSHSIANRGLSAVSRTLFRNRLHDSQSGMWVFRSYIWKGLDVRSSGMAFSQEIKNAAMLAGYRCLEVPIEYGKRGGEVKLNALHDGAANLVQLFEHRLRASTHLGGGMPPARRAVAR